MNSRTLEWDELRRSERRTLSITVRPDRSILVRAPISATEDEIRARLWRRRRWIWRQQEFFRQFEPRVSARSFVSGETHLYLGRRYRLKVLRGDQLHVRLHAGYIEVTLPTATSESVEAALRHWYRERAEVHLTAIFADVLEKYHRPLPTTPAIRIRKLAKRWGTCNKDGRIDLNVDLIRVPRSCIEYVAAHELCHVLVPDHSAEFYGLLQSVMPDWKERKARLEVIAARA